MTVQPIKDNKQVHKMLKILDDQNPRNALLFRVGLNTILRIQDILNIKVKHIFHPDGSFRGYLSIFENKTKNHRRRIMKNVKLNSLIRQELKKHVELFELDQDDFIFFSMHNPDNPLDRVQAWKILKTASREAGIKNFGTHSMRKTLAWNIYTQTKDLALVMIMLNHKSPSVTMRYLGITQESIDNTYEEFAIG
jgi:integrase|tara:strand:+ start:476 stop:1057 length:582 start_codon:yes stop_codon:yes gene_type:complete